MVTCRRWLCRGRLKLATACQHRLPQLQPLAKGGLGGHGAACTRLASHSGGRHARLLPPLLLQRLLMLLLLQRLLVLVLVLVLVRIC